MLLGTSMGGAWQTASAANEQESGQTADLTGTIEAPFAEVAPSVATTLSSRSVYHTRTGNYAFISGPSVLVPLTNTSALQSDAFNTSGRLAVTYTAECAVGAAAGNTFTWMDIDIELVRVSNGAITVLPPSNAPGGQDALCTADGFAGTSGWRMSSITGIAGIPTGLPLADYRVQIRARLSAGGAVGWLGDTSLVIRK